MHECINVHVMKKIAKKSTKTLAQRARDMGIGPRALAAAAGLSHTTVWRALKTNALPPRNSAAHKLRTALQMDVSHG